MKESIRCDARQIRRLLDLDHHSRMDFIDDALHQLGKKLVVDIQPLTTAKPMITKHTKPHTIRKSQ